MDTEFSMVKRTRIRWNTLKVALTDPSAVPNALKDLWARLRGSRCSIEERIAEQQRRLYGTFTPLTRAEASACDFAEADEKRIEYYLGDIGRQPVSLNSQTPEFRPDTRPFKLTIADYTSLLQAAESRRIKDGDTLPLLHLFSLLPEEYKNKKFLYRLGDNWKKSRFEGLIAKSRPCDDLAVTLLKINPVRNWKDLYTVGSLDIDFQQKKTEAVWRGATTGDKKTKGTRTELVQKFFYDRTHFDVGFSQVLAPKDPRAQRVKDMKSIREMLQYKFLICLEGNDVATGLKWMLQSNSVVMMPRPTTSGWLMEDRLEPFVHYIPLADDFSDAKERFDWALNNEAACIEISNNASQFMDPFLDPRRETLIECEVFRRYLNNIEFD